MIYPVAVWFENNVYSAVVPDLPGVITEADSLDALHTQIIDAALGWMASERTDGRSIPASSPRETLTDSAYDGCQWLLVDIRTPENA